MQDYAESGFSRERNEKKFYRGCFIVTSIGWAFVWTEEETIRNSLSVTWAISYRVYMTSIERLILVIKLVLVMDGGTLDPSRIASSKCWRFVLVSFFDSSL